MKVLSITLVEKKKLFTEKLITCYLIHQYKLQNVPARAVQFVFPEELDVLVDN